jgi:hypothetical protein
LPGRIEEPGRRLIMATFDLWRKASGVARRRALGIRCIQRFGTGLGRRLVSSARRGQVPPLTSCAVR